jgi:hypothetical protein
MGLYDTLIIEADVPNMPSRSEYQTKDLDNALFTFFITKKGEIYRENWEHEWKESTDHFFGGYLDKVEGSYHRDYLTDFHGDIKFISVDYGDEFVARFTHGKLEYIKLCEKNNEPVLHERNQEW